LDADNAQQLLVGAPRGTYIIRFSSQPHAYAVSYVSDNQGTILKAMIVNEEDKSYVLKGATQHHPSLAMVIKSNSASFLRPYVMK
jgi:hypothetical protein